MELLLREDKCLLRAYLTKAQKQTTATRGMEVQILQQLFESPRNAPKPSETRNGVCVLRNEKWVGQGRRTLSLDFGTFELKSWLIFFCAPKGVNLAN
jgi:hypothetical protein